MLPRTSRESFFKPNSTPASFKARENSPLSKNNLHLCINAFVFSGFKPIDSEKTYVVAGWASVNEGTEGPPIYALVSDFIAEKKTVSIPKNQHIRISGAG